MHISHQLVTDTVVHERVSLKLTWHPGLATTDSLQFTVFLI